MDANRKLWNEQHQDLREALSGSEHAIAMQLFLALHAMVHAPEVSLSGLYSFETELWNDLDDETARRIPPGGEHSIAWMLWHAARIEDMTMNVLAAGLPQIYLEEAWQERLKINVLDSGNAMDPVCLAALSAAIDLAELRAYRQAVGLRTREVIPLLPPPSLKLKVDPIRLHQLEVDEAVVEAAAGLLNYWGGKTVCDLLLMPPTRHNFVHLNEAARQKAKLLPRKASKNKTQDV